MVKKSQDFDTYQDEAPVMVDSLSVEERLVEVEKGIKRILDHLDPHGTSRPLRENSEEQ
jgi:hypothetical protein